MSASLTPHPHLGTSPRDHGAGADPRWGLHSDVPGVTLPPPSAGYRIPYTRAAGYPRHTHHNVAFHPAGSPEHYGFCLRLPARGGRRRKRLRCALRACRPGLRRSAGSTILRGSPSSTDRLPAPRFRCSRGPAQRALQSTPVVLLEVDMSSTMGLQWISGASCTSPRTLFCLTSVPRHRSQKAATADPDRR